MTRGELSRPSGRARGVTLAALACLLLGLAAFPALAGKPQALPEGPVVEIRFQGNDTITAAQLKGRIKSRVGREVDRAVLDDDIRALSSTKWFSDVRVEHEPTADGKGVVLVFVVEEMPMIREVQFVGLEHLKLKDVEEATNLRRGARADQMAILQAPSRIERMYQERGYEKAEVRLVEGADPADRRVVIEVAEGPKFRIENIDFVGNTFVDDGVLATKIESRRGYIGTLGERRSKDGVDNDRRALIKYYQDHGYFDVEVAPTVQQGSALGRERINFTISEGARYRVRNVVFEGNQKIPAKTLSEGLLLKPGDFYDEAARELDHKSVMQRYWAIGCIKTAVERDQPITDKPGFVDVVYNVSEGSPFYVGQVIFKGNVHTRDKVFRREFVMAGLLPGEILDLNRLDKAKQRIIGTGFVAKDTQPGVSKALEIAIKNERPGDKPFGEDVAVDPSSLIPGRLQNEDEMQPAGAAASPPPLPTTPITLGGPSKVRRRAPAVPAALEAEARALEAAEARAVPRMQSPGDPELTLPGDPPSLPPLEVGPNALPTPAEVPVAPDPGSAAPGVAPNAAPGLNPFGRPSGVFDPLPNTVPAAPPVLGPPPESPGPNPKVPNQGGPVDRGDRNPGLYPNTPNINMTDVGPDRQEPYPNRSFADIVTTLDEAPTGRIQFGVGASSFGGLNGSVILHESNFDITALPRSWQELRSGRAFRGAGQEFRIELMPGTLINRYSISFRDPYLFDLPIGLGLNGYQFSRYYTDWSERRSGGRFSLGYQVGPQTYADAAFRIEDVDIHGFKYPAPADLLAVQGHTTLATLRPAIRFDNRNNPNAPSSGSYLEAAFEQGWGSFTYPKVTLEGRQHFTLGARPDNSGKRTLSLRGFVGATGRDTPIYERFFAGDFRSFRGFYYRGVGPHTLGVNTGGVLMALGTIEYQFPWNASDTLQQVIFCDFGTVEADYKFTSFRASVGTGLRVVIPQITGQLPLAFDLAFPVSKDDGDHVRYFSFNIGAFF